MVKRIFFVFTIVAVMVLLIQGGIPQSGQAASPTSFIGTFSMIWGDGAQGSQKTYIKYFIATERYNSLELLISEDLLASAGGGITLNRQPVVVNGSWHEVGKSIIVQSIGLADGGQSGPHGAYGALPWVSILCKFADVEAEPNDLEFFKQMYSSDYPGLDHFWRENSYDLANLVGSDAYGWYVLPHERAYYFDQDGNLLHQLAAEDCTGVAEPEVYFPAFAGINLMFNDVLDCCAWGGAAYLCLDGLCQYWPMTWEPPWGYQNITVIAHETGHGFGLPHSSGNYGQTYDNKWDVMSDAWAPCGRGGSDPVFGCLGQHTIGYHKNLLGWFTPGQLYMADPGSIQTITLERTALPQTDNYLTAFVPMQNSPGLFFTVEARQLVGYDEYNPGAAIIIHDVNPNRDNPAHVIDIDGNGETGDEGAMWIPGETFRDFRNGISIKVDSATDTGYVVTISNYFTPTESVEISGAETGFVGDSIAFTATISPQDATTPITFTWEATDQAPVEQVGDRVDRVEFNWEEPGSKVITVTASNAGGSVVATHDVTISRLFPLVSIEGPAEGEVGGTGTFTATSVPTDVVLPVTYTWKLEGQLPIIHTGGLSDTMKFTWDEPGTKIITVTAQNINGSSSDFIPVVIRMAPESLEISGVESGLVKDSYTFTAAVLPITTTVPITYHWKLDGVEEITHTSGITDTLAVSWDKPGEHQILVEASNPAGNANDTWLVTIFIEVYLPISLRE